MCELLPALALRLGAGHMHLCTSSCTATYIC
jgi:hypothetical protein